MTSTLKPIIEENSIDKKHFENRKINGCVVSLFFKNERTDAPNVAINSLMTAFERRINEEISVY